MYKHTCAHEFLNMFKNMLTNSMLPNDFPTYFFGVVALHHYAKQMILVLYLSYRAQGEKANRHLLKVSPLVKSQYISFKGRMDSVASLSKGYT